MFGFFRKKRPAIEFLAFGPEEKVKFRCTRELETGQQELLTTVLGETFSVQIDVQQVQDGVYSGKFLGPHEVAPYLNKFFPPTEAPPENRRAVRVSRGLRVLSPDLPGFKGMTTDISTTGLRLSTSGYVAPGSVLQMRLEPDDSRLGQLELKGEVCWSRNRHPDPGYVAGISFLKPTSRQKAILRDFLADLQDVECGVLKKYQFYD